MRLLYCLLLVALSMAPALAESPHGPKFKMDCALCHNEESWKVDRAKVKFNHNKTKFPLIGQHKTVECNRCHTDLVFKNASRNCSSCHTDVHQNTVDRDCERCHTPRSWLVTNVKQVHRQVGFPLVGAHAAADCNRCHKGAKQLRFDKMNRDCYSCHQAQYNATSKPNHREKSFSTDCYRCHNMVGHDWSASGKGFEHGFFPLVGGHSGLECSKCHKDPEFQFLPNPDCKSCHFDDYKIAKTKVVAHTTKFTKFACNECHSVYAWNRNKFRAHDGWFKISSGDHKGVACLECHTNDTNWKSNCKRCHD